MGIRDHRGERDADGTHHSRLVSNFLSGKIPRNGNSLLTPRKQTVNRVTGDGHENMKFSSSTGVFRSCQTPCCPPRNSRDTAPRSSALALQ